MAGKMKGIEQMRAKTAYNCVKEIVNAASIWDDFIKKYNIKDDKKKDVKKKHENVKKKYKSGAKKLPVLIKTNGLGQSLAFIKNRDDGWKIIYQQLTQWLQEKEPGLKETTELVEGVIKMESYDYRQITVECISFLNWLRRFVDGLMEDVEEENS